MFEESGNKQLNEASCRVFVFFSDCEILEILIWSPKCCLMEIQIQEAPVLVGAHSLIGSPHQHFLSPCFLLGLENGIREIKINVLKARKKMLSSGHNRSCSTPQLANSSSCREALPHLLGALLAHFLLDSFPEAP